MENKKEFIDKDFEKWIWISHILMQAFITRKVSPILMVQPLSGEKQHQKNRFIFYHILSVTLTILIPLFYYLFTQVYHNYYFDFFYFLISVISVIACIQKSFDSYTKYKLLKEILTSSKEVQNKYKNHSQAFIDQITRIFSVDIPYDLSQIEKNKESNNN